MGNDKEIMSVVLLSGRFKMSVVLLSGRFKMSVSLLNGIEIAAEKRLFLKEKNEIIKTGHRKDKAYSL